MNKCNVTTYSEKKIFGSKSNNFQNTTYHT